MNFTDLIIDLRTHCNKSLLASIYYSFYFKKYFANLCFHGIIIFILIESVTLKFNGVKGLFHLYFFC